MSIGGAPIGGTSIGDRLAVGLPALVMGVQPSTAASGAANSPSPRVDLTLDGIIPQALAGVVITASLATGAGSLSGTLTATTDASGHATFPNLIVTGASTDTVAFNASNYLGIESNPFVVTTGGVLFRSYFFEPA